MYMGTCVMQRSIFCWLCRSGMLAKVDELLHHEDFMLALTPFADIFRPGLLQADLH